MRKYKMKKALTVLAVLVASACLFLSCGNKTKADNSLEDLKARGVFVIGLDDAFPPMGYRDSNNEIVGYEFVNLGKLMDLLKAHPELSGKEAIEKIRGHYGQWDNAAKYIDPRKE